MDTNDIIVIRSLLQGEVARGKRSFNIFCLMHSDRFLDRWIYKAPTAEEKEQFRVILEEVASKHNLKIKCRSDTMTPIYLLENIGK